MAVGWWLSGGESEMNRRPWGGCVASMAACHGQDALVRVVRTGSGKLGLWSFPYGAGGSAGSSYRIGCNEAKQRRDRTNNRFAHVADVRGGLVSAPMPTGSCVAQASSSKIPIVDWPCAMRTAASELGRDARKNWTRSLARSDKIHPGLFKDFKTKVAWPTLKQGLSFKRLRANHASHAIRQASTVALTTGRPV